MKRSQAINTEQATAIQHQDIISNLKTGYINPTPTTTNEQTVGG